MASAPVTRVCRTVALPVAFHQRFVSPRSSLVFSATMQLRTVAVELVSTYLVWVWMWSKWNSHTLLVEMQNITTVLEKENFGK